MRFSALSALVVLGASLVSASPIRVVVAELNPFEHAVADVVAHPAPVVPLEFIHSPAVALPEPLLATSGQRLRRPGCQGMRAKALSASNALRQWLGLEPIKLDAVVIHHAHRIGPHDDMKFDGPVDVKGGNGKAMKIEGPFPVLPFVGTPVRPAFAAEVESEEGWPPALRPRPVWHHGHHRLHGSFLRRVHFALMSLGPWEGRAVAFVLGCGIGVLLRMVWVLALVTVRAFRGTRDEETEYEVVFDEAEMLVPPPQYTILQGSEAVPVNEKSDKN